ncbi:polysaccharide pyruvyl transferase family protein [Piscinibacter sp. XHJ-5]|uniref:polysaccharide pyruvyl transferase family protein n=1 Tax=Piscinibacter sp. XHJ-5 TaxID=3037797 RepID=UPI002452F5A3|nr:polysaccharide pyruvyl transferase family protein [Piscinibacter sp. XHJ-5]
MSAPGSPIGRASPLESTLRELRDTELLYCPNPGNAGDVFITCATYQLLDRLGCRYRLIPIDSPAEATRGRVVLYGGGGALVPLYGAATRFIDAHHASAAKLIVLPHTIRGNETLLAALGGNVHLFCREMPSFEHVKRHAAAARVDLDDDLAIHFDCERAAREAEQRFWPFVSTPGLAWRNAKRAIRGIPALLAGRAEHRLTALRTDTEKTDIGLPRGNVDLSNVFNVRLLDPLHSLEATWRMMRFIDRFDSVTTNRLHVCIMAALRGKRVDFLPNSYGKNRAVYEQSMAGRFANVTWCESTPPLPTTTPAASV